jgi:hypothetical protein
LARDAGVEARIRPLAVQPVSARLVGNVVTSPSSAAHGRETDAQLQHALRRSRSSLSDPLGLSRLSRSEATAPRSLRHSVGFAFPPPAFRWARRLPNSPPPATGTASPRILVKSQDFGDRAG